MTEDKKLGRHEPTKVSLFVITFLKHKQRNIQEDFINYTLFNNDGKRLKKWEKCVCLLLKCFHKKYLLLRVCLFQLALFSCP